MKLKQVRNVDSKMDSGLPGWNDCISWVCLELEYTHMQPLLCFGTKVQVLKAKRGSESDTLRGVDSSTAAGSVGVLDLLSVKPGASSSSYMVLPPSHKHLSVSENTQPTQRVDHCVGTRPANKDNLSALLGSSLLLAAAAVTENGVHGHISLPLLSRGGAGWHCRSPLSQVWTGAAHIPSSARHGTTHTEGEGACSGSPSFRGQHP